MATEPGTREYRIEVRYLKPTDNGYAMTDQYTEWSQVGSYWTTDEYYPQILQRLKDLRRETETAWVQLKSSNDHAVEQTVIQLMVKQSAEYRVTTRMMPKWEHTILDQFDTPELVEDLMKEQVELGLKIEKL